MKLFLFILVVFFAGLCAANFVFAANALDVVISEICWMGTKNSSADEWIELYNNTNQDINLENWGLYEAGGKTLIEPLTGTIKAKSYYLIERTDDTTVRDIPASQKPSGWGGYGLKNSGEHLQLLDSNLQVIDEVNCIDGWFAGETAPDYKTMERKNLLMGCAGPDNWQTSAIAGGTPLAQNSNPTEPKQNNDHLSMTNKSESGLLTIEYPGGVIINEILPSPEGPDAENEWIEIFNQNNFSVDISGWKITDTQGKIKSYTLPQNTIIKARSFLLLQRPQTKITLNNSGDGLNLTHPNGTIADTAAYKKAKLNQSYNRIGGKWIWSSIPTPGKENIISKHTNKRESNTNETKSAKATNRANIDNNQANKGAAAGLIALNPGVLNSVKYEAKFGAGNKLAAITLALASAGLIILLKRSTAGV